MTHSLNGRPLPRVLVVEDNPVQRELVCAVLAPHAEVEAVGTLAEARGRLDTPRRYGAVVGDLWLPDGHSLELAHELRQRDPDLPVLLVSGNPTMNAALAAVEAGVYRFLTKPFDPEILVREVTGAARVCRVARLRRRVLHLIQGRVHPRPGVTGVPTRHVLDEWMAHLWLAAQPIVHVPTRSVYAYEVLLRSSAPSFPGPPDMIEACRRHHCILDLSSRIRRLAAERASGLEGDTRLFVNLHPEELGEPSLGRADDPLLPHAERITYEITERDRLESTPGATGVIQGLRSSGFAVALDDLGCGYSGLSLMVELQPEAVKLDMSLVRGVDRDPTRSALIHAVLDLSTSLGIRVIAEGVETRQERDALSDLGCEYMQGYLFGRPARGLPHVEGRVFDG